MEEADLIPDSEFRAAGFTGEARKYPLSPAGCAWLAAFNGISEAIMPRAWRYAPNPYMRDYIEQKATRPALPLAEASDA